MNLGELIRKAERACASKSGYMGVELEGITCEQELYENIRDEIMAVEETLAHSDIEEEWNFGGIKPPEARGYVKKMKNFIYNHEKKKIYYQITLTPDQFSALTIALSDAVMLREAQAYRDSVSNHDESAEHEQAYADKNRKIKDFIESNRKFVE